MYKVILVDDEKNITDGMRDVIDWKEMGCEICATASDGEEGAEIIKALNPDIIITDIKMRAVSGLDMLEQTADFTKNAKIIVMTGYRDFEYAHKAISLGVSAFILKPTDINEIKNAVKNAVSELNKDKSVKTLLSELKYKTESDCYDIDISVPVSDFDAKDNDWGNYAVITMDFPSRILGGTKDELHEVFGGIVGAEYGVCVIKSVYGDDFSVVLSSNNSDLFGYGVLFPKAESIRKNFSEILSRDISVGVSDVSTDAKELKVKFFEAKQALEYKLYSGTPETFFYSDIQNIGEAAEEQTVSRSALTKNMTGCILTGNIENLNVFFEEFEKNTVSEKNTEELKEICKSIVFEIYDLYKTINKTIDADEAKKSAAGIIENSFDKNEIAAIATKLARDVTKKFYDYNNTLFGIKLKKAISYISESYGNQITREDVAKAVGVTPNYVSILFRKGLETTLMEYITRVRIDEAKRLLKETDEKIYQIAAKVGFEDAYYFSKIFKNVAGVSPKEWRINELNN